MYILVADDEDGFRNLLAKLFKDKHEVLTATDGQEALALLEKHQIDLVITDNQMPKMTGLELIPKGKAVSPATSFILMTAFGNVDQAVDAIKKGADDYLMKPFDFDEMVHRVNRIQELRSFHRKNELRHEVDKGTETILGASKAILETRAFVKKVAPVTSAVLIMGPSGTGKEVVARSIHETSDRASGPFIAVNCASLSEQLLESELFGHEKGSFTGAIAAKPGKFELAQGGTVFLDEIGELAPSIQAKLLRVLQEKEFFRIGGTRLIKMDARVIAATHRTLPKMVDEGTFREDLFFRLNVLTLNLPPLMERREDIPILIDFFWRKLGREIGKKSTLSPETEKLLLSYSYPGNIRQLQNILERLLVLAPENEMVTPDILPAEIVSGPRPTIPAEGKTEGIVLGQKKLPDFVDEFESAILSKAMMESGHNQVHAAQLLGISRTTLQSKLKKFGLERSVAYKKSA